MQPKAAGSSLMAALTNHMACDALKIAGLTEVKACLTVPLATGMALALTLLGLRQHWKTPPDRRVVLWSRIDQKSCAKAVVTAGFELVVVPLARVGDELRTDGAALEAALEAHGDRVFAVLTTASCFAPRAPDDLEMVSRLVSRFEGVGHVVNNAYGLQVRNSWACTAARLPQRQGSTPPTCLVAQPSPAARPHRFGSQTRASVRSCTAPSPSRRLQCQSTMKKLSRAMRVGRVDAIVQSTDKNFMVPVGGALIAVWAFRCRCHAPSVAPLIATNLPSSQYGRAPTRPSLTPWARATRGDAAKRANSIRG